MPFGVSLGPLDSLVGTVLEAFGGNLVLTIGLAATGLLTYWFLDEYRDADDTAEAIEGAGDRADSFFGGTIGAFGSLLTVVLTITVTVANQLLMTGSALNEAIEAPALFGQAITGLIAFAGLKGLIPADPVIFAAIATLLFVLVLWARYSGGGSRA